jgi:hypothetical protein
MHIRILEWREFDHGNEISNRKPYNPEKYREEFRSQKARTLTRFIKCPNAL